MKIKQNTTFRIVVRIEFSSFKDSLDMNKNFSRGIYYDVGRQQQDRKVSVRTH